MSIINYVDKMIIFDTGSKDKTKDTILSIVNSKEEYKNKIIFEDKGFSDRRRLALLRQEMIDRTYTDYFLVLDGDEIWWDASIKELIDIIDKKEPLLLAQHHIICARDIFHYRNPNRDVYPFLDKERAASIRLYSMKIPGIHCGGEYGYEGFFDKDENEVQCGKYKIEWQEQPYFHTSYISRSTRAIDDIKSYSRLKKMFTTYDHKFPDDYKYPEVLYLNHPSIVPDPFKKGTLSIRDVVYFMLDDLRIRKLVDYLRQTYNKFHKGR